MKIQTNSLGGFRVTFTNPYSQMTVKELLETKLLIPRKIRHFLRTKKHLLVNQQLVTWQDLVTKGDEISLSFDPDDYPQKKIPFGNSHLVECLYQDSHLIVVNKPEGMKTHGNEPNELALLNHVSAFVGQTCYIIHRLDMETSGAIIFAKNPFILPIMNRLLENREIGRNYWALIDGVIENKDTVLQFPIGRHRHDRRKRLVDLKHGQKAITHVKRLKTYRHQFSLVDCSLKTGRTHQIRVHLSHIGHPIVGDPLYQQQTVSQRLMLHAHQLYFKHPLTLELIVVTAKSETFEKGLP
ncbi:RluA family pseudouridine synthase [Streptococcus porcinus]|uniref:Pseudouridine synthase n=1 Tax=Streptococcus porcinus TaxID=1340 RepID=A0A7V9WQB9_STRPO|nr:RluA family pseudouridine synthase [Streptococcus porcinus]MBA2795147.1 RluA family pseudouridine synthase [Streptococcus porcinus]